MTNPSGTWLSEFDEKVLVYYLALDLPAGKEQFDALSPFWSDAEFMNRVATIDVAIYYRKRIVPLLLKPPPEMEKIG